jgi:heptosyltransferase-3
MLNIFLNNFKPGLIKIYLFRILMFCIQFLFFHPNKFESIRVKRILVIRLKHLGDCILSFPVLKALQENFPNSQLTVVTGDWNLVLLEEFNFLYDEVVFYNVTQYCRKKSQKMTLKQRVSVLKKLAKYQFDLTIDLDGSWGFLCFFLLRKTKFLSAVESLQFLQNLQQLKIVKKKITSYSIHTQHELLNLAETLRILGLKSLPEQFHIKVKSKTEKKVLNFLKEKLLNPNKLIVGIQPHVFQKYKLWDVVKFAELTERLIVKYNAQIVFFGSSDDSEYIQKIQSKIIYPTINATILTISEFIGILRYCNLLICLDSFPQHAAFLLQIPTLSIFRTNTFRRWISSNPDFFSVVFNESEISINDLINNLPKKFLKSVS